MALLLLPAWAASEGDPYGAYAAAAKKAEAALIDALTSEREQVYIYKEYADTEKHFTQKAKIGDIVKKGDILKLKEASGGGFAVSIIAKD